MATPTSRVTGKPDSTRTIKEDAAKNRLKEIEADEQIEVENSDIALDDSPVLTAAGTPDMRFKENRRAFLFDRAKTIRGTPDNRLKRNRPDIQKVHADRGDDRPNCRFAGPGRMRGEE